MDASAEPENDYFDISATLCGPCIQNKAFSLTVSRDTIPAGCKSEIAFLETLAAHEATHRYQETITNSPLVINTDNSTSFRCLPHFVRLLNLG